MLALADTAIFMSMQEACRHPESARGQGLRAAAGAGLLGVQRLTIQALVLAD